MSERVGTQAESSGDGRATAQGGSLRVAVSGASGLIGGAVSRGLAARGHVVVRMVRRGVPRDAASRGTPRGEDQIEWDPARGLVDPEAAPALDAVIHLAGESIASGRWTRDRKQRIRQSRIDGTAALVESFGRMKRPPASFLCASAIGYYGADRDQPADETAALGKGFLAEVCRDWEAAAQTAAKLGTRVVNLRFSVVLASEGGALPKIAMPFRFGIGGRVGSGRQWFSWIALDDVAGAVVHCLESPAIRGPVNVTAPAPVSNAELTRVLARVLRRPALFPVPAVALRLALGEMAEETVLASTHAIPGVLEASGFVFRYPELEPALRAVLGSRSPLPA